MVIGDPETVAAANAANAGGNGAGLAHPSGIPQDQIDNIMSGIANTGDVKMNNHRKKLRQRFDIIKKLGQGTYGKVQLGINKETGQEVAIKTIKKCKIEAEADLVRIRREVQIMSSVQHPNIIHIYEVFENREKMVLVMEFAAGGELYDYLSERKVLAEEEARRIFRQVATAVYYCHKHKICHRDLKLENILLDEQGNAKIADFGLSNVFDDQRLLATFCGSPLYASPEIVEGTPYQGPEVDCWSLGVLLYTLVYGSMPFDGSNFKRLVKQISQGDYYEPKKPSRASSLIRDMLTVCPRKRATIEQICSHWWVNENDNVSCLELAEDLANRTPVRLDVLLSLTPTAITAEQLVVPSAADGNAAGKGNERVPRSHSVGSIRDIAPANTEAERKILDMVAAGGEAALMPSPTRTITPAQSPVQTKRKLQPTVSTENAMGTTAKKKEKPANNASFVISETTTPLSEETPMDTEGAIVEEPETPAPAGMANNVAPNFSHKDIMAVSDLCEQLMVGDSNTSGSGSTNQANDQANAQQQQQQVLRQKTAAKLDAVEETPEEKDATKVIKKFVNKHKTADLVNAITQATPAGSTETQQQQQQQQQANNAKTVPPPFVRKCSLQDETPLNKFNAERRKSRILETAEKFQAMNAGAGGAVASVAEKPKKFVIPGVSVGSFKKEYERKASTTTPTQGPTAGERRALEQVAAAAAAAQDIESMPSPPESPSSTMPPGVSEMSANATATTALEASDSKNSVSSISLDEARRSMENSIALLRQAQNESSKEVDQLCAKTESIGMTEPAVVETERERKLKNARAIIGNAIQPVIRRPTPFYGISGVGGGGGSIGVSVGVGYGVGYDQMHATSGSFISGINDSGHLPFEAMSKSALVAPSNTSAPNLLTPSSHLALAAAKKTIQDRLFAGGVPQIQAQAQQQQQQQQQIRQQQQRMQMQMQKQQQQQQQQWHLPATTPPLSSFNHHQINHNHGNSIYNPNMNTLPTPFNASPFKMIQQQLQQKCNEAKQTQSQLKQEQYQFDQFGQLPGHWPNHPNPNQYQVYNNNNNMFTPPPSPLNAPVAFSNTKTTNTTQTAAIMNANAYATNANANSFNNSRRPMPFHLAQDSALPAAMWLKSSPGGDPNPVKTSTASITLKSATLPRRKTTAKADIQLEIQPRIVEQPAMRFTTEMQHPVADLRSAPPREGPVPYSPIKMMSSRATSLEPKEHIIPIQRPPQSAYTRTTSNTTTRSGSLSRQSTVDSESDTTTATNISQSTITGSSQPIKKSPREFIIPIAVEGGGFITPREGSIEPSESGHTTTTSSRTTFGRFRPATTRRIGSLLSDAGIEEGSPFQKMRTASITRDGDDDPRFTLHRLRSSRPVKKISQDNDSQSSGEEDDDDDGFEILTAENLFSTLLQRVRALTNRLNVNNDFPTSSRLLSNMRQGQSPFWNQQSPFGSRLNSAAGGVGNSGSNSNASSGLGAPWRHSMSRDLGSDMESMFSRTGATLPRGSKTGGKRTTTTATITSSNTTTAAAAAAAAATSTVSGEDKIDGKAAGGCSGVDVLDEPLDLADLDLSRLRLSKQDLETLSSITPGLPKCFQEQLLAKLPPTQARKLSRTLSMQNSTPATVAVSKQVYKRSQSGGRGCIPEPSVHDFKLDERRAIVEETKSPPLTDAPTTTAASSAIYRRSMSRTRNDNETSIPTPSSAEASNSNSAKSRSNSVCRDDYGKSALSGTFTSDINDKYKYYSPYLNKSSTKENSAIDGATSPQKRYSVGLGRPPSGCLSPPLQVESGSSSLRRRSSQRRISRFLRPDFFDEPPPSLTQTHDENQYQREKRQRERETQSVLREIREKSADRLTVGNEREEIVRRKHSLPNVEASQAVTHLTPISTVGSRHVRNKSMEMYLDGDERRSASQEASLSHKRRSLSRPRDLETELDKHELASKILQELQLLSAVHSQHEDQLPVPLEMKCDTKTEESYNEKTATIKKAKKLKPKEKSTESSTDIDGKMTTTTVVKKVKKVVKKSESVKTPKSEMSPSVPADVDNTSVEQQSQQPIRETKLKRPKSYPMKETALSISAPKTSSGELGASAVPSTSKLPCKTMPSSSPLMPESTECAGTATMPRESRLMRPKSYPASKLAPTKDLKKVTRSGAAIPSSISEATESVAKSYSSTRQITSEEKSESVTPTSNGLTERDTSSSGETRPTSLKKIVKVTKKSKLVPPTSLTPTTPTTTATTTPADSSKESSPATIVKAKEKSPEKKPSKGLLYAIGQKFEKLRDSAMSKEKKAMMSAANASAIGTTTKKSSPESSSPEKIKEKTLLKKKKSLDSEKALETASPNVKAIGQQESLDKPIKGDKRSRIDSMIRTLRERSVPRTQIATESNYIKRAVSVEDLPGRFNKNAVNKVLGLFKRFEKDSGDRKVRSTRSTSNIERQLREGTPSPIYENAAVIASAKAKSSKANNTKAKVNNIKAETITAVTVGAAAAASEENCNCETVCPDCLQNQSVGAKRRDEAHAKTASELSNKEHTLQSNKEKRKGLMLDLAKLERMDNANSVVGGSGGGSSGGAASGNSYRGIKSASSHHNGNGLYSNLPPYPGAVKSSSNNSSSQQSMDNVTNNNSTMTNNNSSSLHTSQTSGYRTASAHEINRNNLLTPSFENIANYSSDSRSYQDDCASTSTFLSPTDEPELYFDNWSICSEDNYMLHASPSPTVSRLSRASQLSSPTRCSESSDPNESVIDRIKRRSFYCRFNEKKPKRTSSIVGPSAVRDYYREQQAAVKSRTATKVSNEERAPSPDIAQQFFRPLKLSPVGTELKPPVYRSTLDYSTASAKPRKSLNDIRTTTSPSFLTKRYGSTSIDNDYSTLSHTSVPMRYKSSSSTSPYENSGGTGGIGTGAGGSSGYYSTYNPKRRSSYTLNGTLSSGSGVGAGSSSLGAGTSHIDGYATVGRRTIRPYDQRTMSLLDPSTSSTGSSYHRRDARTPVRDYTSSISRSNSRYRTSSATRSPTNI